MRYLTIIGLLIGLLLGSVHLVVAQTDFTPQLGDPPVAALINVSAPDVNGMVTVNGSAGAVFPAATVAVRNLFTEQVVYVPAGITGSFMAQIYAPANTPLWISPSSALPLSLRDRPGSLPGGPGTIIYTGATESQTESTPITQLQIDGNFADWDAYPDTQLTPDVRALINADSLYLALTQPVANGETLIIGIGVNEQTYELSLNPAIQQAGLWRQVFPVVGDPQTIAVAMIGDKDAYEIRVNLAYLNIAFETAYLLYVDSRSDADSPEALSTSNPPPISDVDEQDGIVYSDGRMEGTLTRFSVSGAIAQGASTWTARGRIDTQTLNPGDTFTIEMDVTLTAPDLPRDLPGLSLIGDISLQPVALADGRLIPTVNANNGWSNLLTPSGLAINNLQGDLPLATVKVPAASVIHRGDNLLAGFRFEIQLPDDLPPGRYAPTFVGKAQIGDGDVFLWTDNGVFGVGDGISRQPLTRLPLILTVGEVGDSRLKWTLFYNAPSDGSRGVIAEEDQGQVALSNRVQFDSPTYILPLGNYSIEPYLLNQLPNAYDMTAAPLLPLLFPGGRLKASVTAPDGTINELPDVPVVQNKLSTVVNDERQLFGAQSPVDAYQLATLNPQYRAYSFDQYGEYEITLSGVVEDIFGNRYTGGGTYRILIAEPLDLIPGMLPGTPFEVGDSLFAGGRVTPRFPAEASISIDFYPLEGETTRHEFDMRADRYGYFASDETPLIFDAPGEYRIDYAAQYTDAQGRLWAASLRSAGIVSGDDRGLVVRGQRGLFGYSAFGVGELDYRPPRFNTQVYPPQNALATGQLRPYFPYFGGDIVTIPDNLTSGVRPALTIQDLGGAYNDWLLGTLQDYQSAEGIPLQSLSEIEELPVALILGGPQTVYNPAILPEFIANDAYAYISAVRPDVAVREFVTAGDNAALALEWDSDDPYNGQIGAGVGGDRPGDYIFLFGGAVIRNDEAGVRSTTGYASIAIVEDSGQPAGVYPPFNRPLMTISGEAIETFFHPTAIRAGQTLEIGDSFIIAGQVAPTIQSEVMLRITSPSGILREFSGLTNDLGYFYDPANDFTADESGVWTVELIVAPTDQTIASPRPAGSVPGVINNTFRVFVLPSDSPSIIWTQGGDTDQRVSPAIPFNFGLNIPAGWRDPRAFVAVTTPSYVLDSGSLRLSGTTVSYQYSAGLLARTFPNLEFEGLGEGASAADVVTLTFVITGMDENDELQIRSRTFTLLHDRLLSVEDASLE